MKSLTVYVCAFILLSAYLDAAETKTRNVFIITIDGLRWQEVFRGAEEALISKVAGGVPEKQIVGVKEAYWVDSAAERRKKLMPFFWGHLAEQGQIFGNRDVGSPAAVLNDQWFSYPGYNEILTGRPDPGIRSNVPIPNPNVTVLEWLNGRPAFAGKVVVCADWRVFTAIINVERSRLPVWVTRQHSPPSMATPRLLEIEKWMDDIPPISADEHFDAFVYEAALELIDRRKPRVFLLGLGEPDTWAHGRKYDRYLDSIRRCDRFIRQLWEKLQTMEQYRGNTTFVITPDHGRGVTGDDWMNHSSKVPQANETWFAALGPDTPARGERKDIPEIHQAQIAATVAAFLGEDFRTFAPEAHPPISDVLPAGK